MAITISSGVDISSLFSTSSTKKSGTDYSSILGLDLADVASVKNGSYGKLMKGYYKQAKADAKSAVGDTDTTLSDIRSKADKLDIAATKLDSASLWKTTSKTETDANGVTKTTESLANADDALKAVKSFVSSYNSVISAASDSETKSVLRKAGWMDQMTRQNSNMLGEAGITVNEDGTLKLDEDQFKKANTTTLKSLFYGNSSYASKVSAKAESIGNSAASTEGIYTGKASWSSELSGIAKSSIDAAVGNNTTTSAAKSASSAASTASSDKSSTTSANTTEIEDKLKTLNERKEALQKSLETASDYNTFRGYDDELKQVKKQIEETQALLGSN